MDKNNNSSFPSDFAPMGTKKSKEWILKACKAADGVARSPLFITRKLKFQMLRKYANGDYDVTKFENFKSAKGTTAGANLNWKIATPLPTIVENLVGQFENQGLKPKVKCLSSQSKTQYDNKLRELKTTLYIMSKKDELEKAGMNVDAVLSKRQKFADEDEVNLYMETDFKDDYTMAMQMAIDFVLNSNDEPYIKRKLFEDLVVLGMGVLDTRYDENFDVRVEWVKPEDFISDKVNNDNYSDSKYRGRYKEYTIDDIHRLSEGKLSEEALMDIAQKASGYSDNGAWDESWSYSGGYGRPYGSFKIRVLDLEYKSTDVLLYEKKPAKNGGFYLNKVNVKKSGKHEYVEKPITNIYKGTWVVGTDYMFNYGLRENMIREKLDNGCYSADTSFSLHPFTPNLREMVNTSLVGRVIGLIDAYILTNLKGQTIIAKSRTQGISLDVAMLGAITNALGEKNMKPLDLIDLMTDKSTYYYSSVTENGVILPNTSPIKEVPESSMNGLMTLAAHEQGILKALEFATGVPLSTIGAPPIDTLVGLQRAAAENRNNATRFINSAYKSILSRTCTSIVAMVQDSINGEAKKIDDYSMSIGELNTDMLEFTKELSGARFGIYTDVLPDAVEQQEFLEAVNKSASAGKITQAQAMKVGRIGKEQPEYAERLMFMYEKKNMKLEQEKAAQAAQAQAQANGQAAQMAEQARQQTLQLEWQLKSQYLQLEYQLKSQLSKVDFKEDVDIELVKGDIKSEHIILATGGGEEVKDKPEDDLRKTSVPREAGAIEPRVFPSKVQ